MPTPAGWYTDPSGRYELRYWDGSRWTRDVRGQGPAGTAEPGATGPPEGVGTPAEVTIAGAGATTAADLQGGAPEGHQLTRAERQASLHGAPRGRRRWMIIGAIVAVLVIGGVAAALTMKSDDPTVKTKPKTTTTEPRTSTTDGSSTTSTSAPATTTTVPGATTTVAAKTSATSAPAAGPQASSAAALPPQVVTTGTWCTNTDATGVNSKGTPMVCSATAKDGTPYPQPTWRPA
jgi:hypothetical protein